MKKGDKRGQFFLIAAIIIAGIVIAIAYTLNYSKKTSSFEAEEIADELRIEAEHVIDYEINNPGTPINELDDFSMKYSSFAEDKEIYYISVDKRIGLKEAYMFNGNQKIYFNDRLSVSETNIEFILDGKHHVFKLEEGRNFYSIVVHRKGGEVYVENA